MRRKLIFAGLLAATVTMGAAAQTTVTNNNDGTTGTVPVYTGSATLGNSPISPKTSPIADIRAYGAIIDGTSDIGTALQNAVNACNAANGNACTVLLPCAGPNGCYLANGSGITYSGSNVLTLKLQGTLHLGSTLVLPDRVALVGDSGCPNGFFQGKGQTGCVSGALVKGTMGTAIATTGSAVVFTPTFSAGSIANFHVNSVITIAGLQTCSATASRTSASVGLGANTIFTLTGCIDSSGNAETGPRTPVGALVTVTGCSDATVDVANSPVVSQDWPSNQEGLYESGATTTAAGCTVVGFDDNTYETVPLTAVSGSTATAVFAHKHAASDIWGMVGVTFQSNTYNHHYLKDLSIGNAAGVELWMDSVAELNLDDVSTSATGNMTSGSLECAGCWQGSWDTVYAETSPVQFCTANCAQPSYPYGIRFTQDALKQNNVGGGIMPLNNIVDDGGIKIDSAGMNNPSGAGVSIGPITGGFLEQIAGAGVMVDPRYLGANPTTISMNNVLLQDNFQGNQFYYVGGTDCCVNNSSADLGDLPSYAPYKLANKYWTSGIQANTIPFEEMYSPAADTLSTGVLSDGRTFTGIFRGQNAGMSPAIIPYPTLPVISNITCPTCSTVTGPDGVANSALEIRSPSGGGFAQVNAGVDGVSATYPGDWIIFGSHVHQGINEIAWGGFWGSNIMYVLSTNGSDTFSNPISGQTQYVGGGALLPMFTDSWSPGVQIAKIAAGDATFHNLDLTLYSANTPTPVGNDFSNWFWAYIPGPNNPAYTGVTQQEVVRWAQQMSEGYMPPGGSTGRLYGNYPLALEIATKSISGTSGTAICTQNSQGTVKQASCYLNGYAQTGPAQTYTFPAPFNTDPVLLESGGSCGSYNPTATATTLTLPANASMTAETCNVIVMGQ